MTLRDTISIIIMIESKVMMVCGRNSITITVLVGKSGGNSSIIRRETL